MNRLSKALAEGLAVFHRTKPLGQTFKAEELHELDVLDHAIRIATIDHGILTTQADISSKLYWALVETLMPARPLDLHDGALIFRAIRFYVKSDVPDRSVIFR